MSDYKQDIQEFVEIWKPVVGFEESYHVSNFGRIKSLIKNRILSLRNNGNGYLSFLAKISYKKYQTYYVHRAVLNAFCPIENSQSLEVNHKNFDRSDNRLENLEWLTPKDNTNYSKDNGNFKERDKIHSKRMRLKRLNNSCHNQKLSVQDCFDIYEIYQSGFNKSEIARKYNVSQTLIRLIIRKVENGKYAI